MATTTVIPGGTYQKGSANLGPAIVPVGLVFVRLEFDITLFTETDRAIAFSLEISYDNGITWRFLAGATQPGGTFVDDEGLRQTKGFFEARLPEPTNVARQVRGTITITGGVFLTLGGTLTTN